LRCKVKGDDGWDSRGPQPEARQLQHRGIEILVGFAISADDSVDDVQTKQIDLLEATGGIFEGKGMFFHQPDYAP
jgi:hypothetical protein